MKVARPSDDFIRFAKPRCWKQRKLQMVLGAGCVILFAAVLHLSNRLCFCKAFSTSTQVLAPQAAAYHQQQYAGATAQPKAAQVTSPQKAVGGYGASQHTRKYHVLVVQADNIYMQWQTRILYYTYLKAKAECQQQLGAACDMGGFTRIFAAKQPDALINEIPTFVAQPVQHEYLPLNRPYGLLQWLQAATIPEQYVMVCETDQFFVKPTPNLMGVDGRIVGYKSGVVSPHQNKTIAVLAQFMPSGKLTRHEATAYLRATGSSPFLASMNQLRTLVPVFYKVCNQMKDSKAAAAEWNWIREMYAFILAVHLAGLSPMDMVDEFVAIPYMSEPKPYQEAYLLHYAYDFNYHMNGTRAPEGAGDWRFHKKDYWTKVPPRHLPVPPTAVLNPNIHLMMKGINEATQNIPCWDAYAENGRVLDDCDEHIPGSVYPQLPSSRQQQQ